ncbi:MAG TPA: penicillin-binding transpeptidase domain-containing protein, partial [Pirellulales bacterium]|nr:penicillin-binding transpeptidase domain-containing protein [Pirellulales bacterium]
GRILAADGTVLAHDEPALALSLQYRWLEEPPNDRWLRNQVRSRLSRSDRRDRQRVEEETARFLVERKQLHVRLARLCNVSPEMLAARMQNVQQRVERISRNVNARRATAPDESPGANGGWFDRVMAVLTPAPDARPPATIVVAEELDHHVVHVGLGLNEIAEIEGHPDRWPGTRVVQQMRRAYDGEALAAHALGHLGAASPAELTDREHYVTGDHVGRMGIERQYESLLCGRVGLVIDETDRTGRLLAHHEARQAEPGQDVMLSIDPRLQRTAEALADDTVRRLRRLEGGGDSAASGAAIVVLDVEQGSVYCAASAPRFDPNALSKADSDALAAMLNDPARPLFDRVTKMALAPGSVFKSISAVALLEEQIVDADETFFCRGFLREPDRLRCMLYRHQGVGHGPTTLADALAKSCNVYFFHHAAPLGADPLVAWAKRFGLGAKTGVDLPDEVSGRVPDPSRRLPNGSNAWSLADTQAMAIGQSTLQVTPLQMTRAMAAIANGGRLVTPRFVKRVDAIDGEPGGQSDSLPDTSSSESISLDQHTLAEVRRGLERVVADEDGTGHRSIYLDHRAIAGKTGTAETGPGRADHAWFVGYAPADRPSIAVGVVIEHAGSGGGVAGPI